MLLYRLEIADMLADLNILVIDMYETCDATPSLQTCTHVRARTHVI
jgi:hypothetical protein